MSVDAEIRNAAFKRAAALNSQWSGTIPWQEVINPIKVGNEEVLLANRARGIFRPRQMRQGVLSIKTTVAREGRVQRYDDVASDAGFFEYRFQGTDPNNHDNRALKESWDNQLPFIYFHGVCAAFYSALFPCFIESWDAAALTVRVVVGAVTSAIPAVQMSEDLRRYSTIEAKVRLHQAAFRGLVLSAYDNKCAISGLPERRLLQAAHILPDRDVRGQPVANNGIALSSLHHHAFDLNLIGIDPDGCIHVNRDLLELHDGPTLQVALQNIDQKRIRFPIAHEDKPNRDYLAERFEQFVKAA